MQLSTDREKMRELIHTRYQLKGSIYNHFDSINKRDDLFIADRPNSSAACLRLRLAQKQDTRWQGHSTSQNCLECLLETN